MAPSSRFSVKRGCSLAPSPLITAPASVGPTFGVCQRQRVSPRHIRHPLLQFVAPPGRGREPGAETAPPAKMPEPQPPQRPRASPRSPRRQRAGAAIGWEQDASTPAEHLQWPEPDPESPRGLWTRMTPTTTPAWQSLACMSARALIKCRVLGPRVWTPLRVLGSRPRNVHFQWSRGPLLSERQKRVKRAPGVSRRHRFT